MRLCALFDAIFGAVFVSAPFFTRAFPLRAVSWPRKSKKRLFSAPPALAFGFANVGAAQRPQKQGPDHTKKPRSQRGGGLAGKSARKEEKPLRSSVKKIKKTAEMRTLFQQGVSGGRIFKSLILKGIDKKPTACGR